MDSIGQAMDEHVHERFRTETDPWGNAWPDPSPVTIELRERRGLPPPALERRRFARVVDSGRRVLVGLRSTVARIRHFGAPNNRMFDGAPAPIPPRPTLPLRDGRVDLPTRLRDELMQRFRESIRGAVRRL